MSQETQDHAQKTEAPTPHRLQEAERKGEFAVSKEVTHLAIILTCLGVVAVVAPYMTLESIFLLRPWIELSYQFPTDGPSLHRAFIHVIAGAFKITLPPMLLLAGAAILAGGAQTRFKPNVEALKPKASNLSPAKGWERLFSSKAIVDFAKSLLRLLLIGTVCFYALRPIFERLDALSGIAAPGILLELQDVVGTLLFWIAGCMVFFAIIDYGYQYFMHLRKMRMSYQEIKEEHKNIEGNPLVKSRLKQLRMERRQTRTMQAVKEATVLIMNPTHYAVALKWDEQQMQAPVVIAKGLDFLALRMRELAQGQAIPIIENPPLARILYDNLKIDQEIKPEYYKAIAEVIRYVMGMTPSYYGIERIEELA